jgi:hypothetical protein
MEKAEGSGKRINGEMDKRTKEKRRMFSPFIRLSLVSPFILFPSP